MRKLLSKLWNDDGGFLISMEMLFIAVILILGIIAGLAALRAAVVVELTELGVAILALDTSYTIDAISQTTGGSGGVQFIDDSGNTLTVTGVGLTPPAGSTQLMSTNLSQNITP